VGAQPDKVALPPDREKAIFSPPDIESEVILTPLGGLA
jgi:hypothetical protein